MQKWVNATIYGRRGSGANSKELKTIQTLIEASWHVGGAIGSMFIHLVGDNFGRKKGILYHNAVVVLAYVMMCGSYPCKSYEMLIVGRLLVGACTGLGYGLSVLYLVEIAPFNIRASVAAFYQLTVRVSYLAAAAVTGLIDLNVPWFAILLVPVVPVLIQVG